MKSLLTGKGPSVSQRLATRSGTADFAKLKHPALFLFGSADSLLNADNALFESLNRMPMVSYINIGLESADPATLKFLNKPLDIEKIEAAFRMMLDINRS